MAKPQDYRDDVGARAAMARKAVGLSQREVAEELGIPPRTYSYYESPKGDLPSSLLVPLAEILGVDVRELLGACPPACDSLRRVGSRSRLVQKAEAIREPPQGEQKFVLKFLDQVLEDYARKS